jgi:hypothetical protein
MKDYSNKLLGEFGELKEFYMPEGKDNENILENELKEKFHMIMARLLHLAKHVRPDINMTLILLCMRVRAYQKRL